MEPTSESPTTSMFNSINLTTPMPAPNTPNAPKFKGKEVSHFLDSLEQYADLGRQPHSTLCSQALRYCSSSVRLTVESEACWAGQDWNACKELLKKLYGSNNKKPTPTPGRLRTWVLDHRANSSIDSLQDIDKYLRAFTRRSANLVSSHRIMQSELNLLFYRGIPDSLRKRIRKKVPEGNLDPVSAPTVDQILGWMKLEFKENDLDAESADDRSSDFASETDSDDSDSEPKKPKKRTKKKKKSKKKKVTFELEDSASSDSSPTVKKVPAAGTTLRNTQRQANAAPTPPLSMDDLTKQLQELRIAQAELARKNGQQPPPNFPNLDANTWRCFMCGEIGRHPPSPRQCHNTIDLINKGKLKYNAFNRLALMDGSELPRAMDGSVSKAIRERYTASTSSGKGKGLAEPRDRPPHMSNFAGIQIDGQDVITGTISSLSSSSTIPAWRAFAAPASFASGPVTRSQKQNPQEELRFDPKRRPDKKQPDDVDRMIRNTPIPPVSQAPKASTAPRPTPPAPQAQAPSSTLPPIPEVNMRGPQAQKKPTTEAAKPTKNQPQKNMAPPPTKAGPSYHITSLLQDSVDADKLQSQILSTPITVTIGELIGTSTELQRRFVNLTKMRRDYSDKPVTANLVERFDMEPEVLEDEVLGCYWANPASDSDDDSEYDAEDEYQTAGVISSRVVIDYDPALISEDDITTKYASAVKLIVPSTPLFAMVTGRFVGTFGGVRGSFMVDSGSELNLVSRGLYEQTSLPLDVDGTRWSLKGVNGGPELLGGCLRDVPVLISGHDFSHHFFVSPGEVGSNQQDVILGQPWLQWYTASINYDRSGAVQMHIWQTGNCCEHPTLSILLCKPGSPWNTTQLKPMPPAHRNPTCPHSENMKASIEEVTDSDEESGN